jgi:tetratricopeptide (TPR) repeat protein
MVNGFLVFFLASVLFKQILKTSESRLCSGLHARGFLYVMMALSVALIFVAHPVQTQAVTYTVQRYASMAAMFYFTSVLFYLKARLIQTGKDATGPLPSEKGISKGESGATPRRFQVLSFYFLSIFFGMAALLSKQNAASLPGAILVLEFIVFGQSWHVWRKKILWLGGAALAWVALVLFILKFFGGADEGRGLLEDVLYLTQETRTVGRWSYLCTQFNVLVTYLRLLVLPVGQNLDYLYPFNDGFFEGYTPLAFIFLLAIAGLGIANTKKRPIVAIGIFWFFVTLSVESSIFPIRDALFEHRLYLPLFGFALVTSYLMFLFLAPRRRWAVIISAFVVLLLGITSHVRNEVWSDSATLWADVLLKNPQNHRAHCNLGMALAEQGEVEEAIVHLSSALQIKPDYPEAHNNLGVALASQGKFTEAIKHYQWAVRIRPDYTDARNNLGVALAKQGNLQESVGHFLEIIEREPGNAEAHNNLGLALAQKGEPEEAIKYYGKAIKLQPGYVEAHYNLGLSLTDSGKADEAIAHYLEALRLKPEYPDAHYRMGLALAEQGRLDEAKHHFSALLRARPRDAKAHNTMGIAFAREGRLDEAIFHFSEALQIKPNYERARKNLEQALKAQAKSPGPIDYEKPH